MTVATWRSMCPATMRANTYLFAWTVFLFLKCIEAGGRGHVTAISLQMKTSHGRRYSSADMPKFCVAVRSLSLYFSIWCTVSAVHPITLLACVFPRSFEVTTLTVKDTVAPSLPLP